MKPMPYLIEEKPCTHDPSEYHAAGVSTHAVHSDGHETCHYTSYIFTSGIKHLSDAECAAHQWMHLYHALSLKVDDYWNGHEWKMAETWWRFETTPHAFGDACE